MSPFDEMANAAYPQPTPHQFALQLTWLAEEVTNREQKIAEFEATLSSGEK